MAPLVETMAGRTSRENNCRLRATAHASKQSRCWPCNPQKLTINQVDVEGLCHWMLCVDSLSDISGSDARSKRPVRYLEVHMRPRVTRRGQAMDLLGQVRWCCSLNVSRMHPGIRICP